MKMFLKFTPILLYSFALISCSGGVKPDASGMFEANEIIVSSEASGKILAFTKEEGDSIIAGEILGFADTLQLDLQRKRLMLSNQALLSKTQDIPKQIASTKQQIENLKNEKSRFESLASRNAASTKQVDDISYQIEIYKKQLAALESNLINSNRSVTKESEALKIQIEQINDQISKCYFKSTINGTLISKYCEVGELAVPGKALYKAADLSEMTLRAYVGSGQLSGLKLGQRVRVLCDNSDGGYKEYEGNLSYISDKAEFTPKTIQTKDERENLVYAVKIVVKNDGYLKIGMYADVKFN